MCLVPEIRKLSEWLLRAAAEPEKSTIAGKRVDEQQQVALILKGSSLVAEAAEGQQVSRTGRRKLTGRKSKPGRSGGLLESIFDNMVERASREMKRGFKSE